MYIENLTPHEVTLFDEEGKEVLKTYRSHGEARVTTNQDVVGEVDGFPLVKTNYGDVVGLPQPKVQTLYIVSMMVAQALPERNDLISPNTSPQSVVRDEGGRIVGVRGFVSYHK